MKTWTVMALKGGVGKTTSVITLAGALALRNKRVLLIDLDPQASCSSYLGYEPDGATMTVYDLFAAAAASSACDIRELPQITAVQGVHIIPAATDLVTLERRCGGLNGMGRVLARELPKLRERYDHCLIDCPPMMGLLVINALTVSELVLVPMQTEDLALRTLDGSLRCVSLVGKSMSRRVPSVVVPTLFDSRTRASRESLLSLRCRDDIALWSDVIPIDTQLREASRQGLPLTQYQPQARAAQAYNRLLDWLLQKDREFAQAAIGGGNG